MRLQNINPADDWVIFQVVDVESGHEQIVVAASVVDAADQVTRLHGAKLRSYQRVAYIDRRPALKNVMAIAR